MIPPLPRQSFCSAAILAVTFMALTIPVFFAPRAFAQERIEGNDYNLDLYAGPVMGSQRIVAMGGAFTAAAESIDGVPWNPASYGLRTHWEPNWFEWDVSFGFALPGTMGDTDFFNNNLGSGLGTEDYLFLDNGLRLQFGYLGVGALLTYNLFSVETESAMVDIETFSLRYGAAWMFLDGQLVVGLGGRTGGMVVDIPSDDHSPVRFGGSADELTNLEAGVVLKPERFPFRLGIAARNRVKSTQVGDPEEDETKQVGPFILPAQVHLPWDVQIGLAWQFGDRPYNIKWDKPLDPKIQMRRDLRRRWCQRERDQVLAEFAESGSAPPENLSCPRLRRRPTSRVWWQEEKRRRSQEEERLDEEVEVVRDEIRRSLKDRYREMERFYWLVTLDVQIIGPTPKAVGLDAFIRQENRPYGEDVAVAVRLGTEVEPVENRLKLRAGAYMEPGRYKGVNPRVHGTGGLEVRLFTWDLFGLLDEFSIRAGAMIDAAPRYLNWGVGLGMWH